MSAFEDMSMQQRMGLVANLSKQQGGLLGGGGLSENVINLAMIMGGLRALGPQPAGQNLASNIAQGVSEGLQLGAALQPKPPLIPEGETALEKTLGEEGAKLITKTNADMVEARKDLQTYEQLISLIEKADADDFGAFADTRLGLAKFADLLGFETGKNISSLELIKNIANKVVLAGLSNFKGAISEGERQFLVDMSAGLGSDKEGALQILNVAKNIQQRILTRGDAMTLYRTQSNNPLNNITVLTKDGKQKLTNFENFSSEYATEQVGDLKSFLDGIILKNQNYDRDNYNNYKKTVASDGTVSYIFAPKGVELNANIIKKYSLTEKEFNSKFGR